MEIVIGDNNVIEDFWRPMIGKKVGEVKELIINYPKNMNDKTLSGKSIEYSATIKKILMATEHKLDEVLAKSLGYEDFQELYEWAKSTCVARYDQMSRDILKRELLEKISNMYDFDVPKNMLDIELSEVKRQIKEEAHRLKKEMTPEIEAECIKIAERRVRLGFVVAEISKKKNIVVSREEISRSIRNIAAMFPERTQEILELYSRKEAFNAVAGPILEAKVIDFLFGIVKIEEKTCSIEDLIAFDEETFDFFKDESEGKKKNEQKAEAKKKTVKNEQKKDENPESPEKTTTSKRKSKKTDEAK
jgi:trigger factor